MVVTNLGEFISQETSRIVSAISQNNSNNESEQENQHEPKFICYEVNSDNEIVWKECDKAEDSLKEPADKAVGRAKNVLQKSKYSNERKSRNRKQSTFSCSESETIERERRKIMLKAKMESKVTFLIKCFKQRLHNRFILASATNKRFMIILKVGEFKWDFPPQVWQSIPITILMPTFLARILRSNY